MKQIELSREGAFGDGIGGGGGMPIDWPGEIRLNGLEPNERYQVDLRGKRPSAICHSRVLTFVPSKRTTKKKKGILFQKPLLRAQIAAIGTL
jgi:hypothetical protein